LATLVSNQPDINPMLINGKPLKSINQYFNKKKAKLMSFIGDKGTSHSIGRLSKKRNQRIDDYLHKASRNIIDYAIKTNSGLIIVGENKHWKPETNIGKKNNQNFVSIPFDKFKAMIEYKAENLELMLFLLKNPIPPNQVTWTMTHCLFIKRVNHITLLVNVLIEVCTDGPKA
jgi:putative transposase